ncbi:MAG: alpha-glucosidase [Zestosphaera sp.]
MESATLLREARDLLVKLENMTSAKLMRKHIGRARASLDYVVENIKHDNVELAKLINGKVREVYSKASSLRGRELSREFVEDVEKVVRWCGLAVYEFTDRIAEVRRAYRSYVWGMVVFFVLGGTYSLPFAVSALVLALPCIMAMSFLKKRRAMGYMMALSTMPLPMVILANISYYCIYALTNASERSGVASQYGMGESYATLFLVLLLVGSLTGLGLLAHSAYNLYKTRDAYI